MVDLLNSFTTEIMKDNSLVRLLDNLPGVKQIVHESLQDPKDEANVHGIV